MSHLARMHTAVKDSEALIRALKRVGIPEQRIEYHEKAILARGYHQEETFNANVIVRKDGFGSDIGWERNPKTGEFTAHLDEFHYRNQHYSQEWQRNLYTFYNVEKCKMELDNKGMEYEEGTDNQNRPYIRARVVLEDNSRSRTVGARR